MLKIFIFILLCLILYQFVPIFVEGLDDGDTDSGSGSGSSSCPPCASSLADQNISYLNTQINSLQSQYTDLSGNVTTLNQQIQQLMQQNSDAASGMVGDQPLTIDDGSTDGSGTGSGTDTSTGSSITGS